MESTVQTAADPGAMALETLVAEDLKGVNRVIREQMQSPVALIPQLAGYIIQAGGKRLRPLLTLGAARLCGYAGERHIPLAACIEFLHTATLLHDDVVDESGLRRGLESANAVWGNKASVLVGDFLFSRAFQVMVADGALPVLKTLSDASAVLAEGEVLQLVTANDTETDESAYLDVIERKTARLFAAAGRLGPLVAERPEAEADALEAFGLNLGVAFQLVDDVLDYSARQEALGKGVGDDFRDGKLTLPVVLAFQRGDAEERAFWCRTLEDMDQRDGDLHHAMHLMTRHNALDDAMARVTAYADAARDALAMFDDGPMRRALLETVDFCVERAY